MSPKKILLGVTAPISLIFMTGHPAHLAGQGWHVDIVVGDDPPPVEGATTHVVPMHRNPAPLADAKALMGWVRLLRKLRPDVVMVGTPKAGLLGIIASWVTRVPRRIYLLHGLRLEGASGVTRRILWVMEKISCTLSTEVLAVSPSLADRTAAFRLKQRDRIAVLGSGSAYGVDTTYYRPGSPAERSRDRESLGIARESFVVGFVGRIDPDKGIETLLKALTELTSGPSKTSVTLLVAGGVEDAEIAEQIQSATTANLNVVVLGHLSDLRPVYGSMDVLCLPSRREGLPTVVIEAAASGVPAAVSNATGCRDSVVDRVTGWTHPVGDSAALARILDQAMRDPGSVAYVGEAARRRAVQEFDRAEVWSKLDQYLGTGTKLSAQSKDGQLNHTDGRTPPDHSGFTTPGSENVS